MIAEIGLMGISAYVALFLMIAVPFVISRGFILAFTFVLEVAGYFGDLTVREMWWGYSGLEEIYYDFVSRPIRKLRGL